MSMVGRQTDTNTGAETCRSSSRKRVIWDVIAMCITAICYSGERILKLCMQWVGRGLITMVTDSRAVTGQPDHGGGLMKGPEQRQAGRK